jgi:serine/threonine-protein kinase
MDTDRRADVWAMGVCLYEILAQRLPFAADNQLDLARRITTEAPAAIEGLPEPVRQILIGALARDPNDRFASAAAMRKRCELTISAMELPSTSEDVATFVETHLAERTARRAEIVARALEEAARRPGNSINPPSAQVRVSARATLDPEAFKEASDGTSSGGGVAGSAPPTPSGARRAWILPVALVTIIVAFSAAGILRRVKTESPAGTPSATATHSVAAPSSATPVVSAVNTATNVDAVPLLQDAAAVVSPLPSAPANTGPRPLSRVEPRPSALPASASAPPTATWGKIPPTTPIIATPTTPTPTSDPPP